MNGRGNTSRPMGATGARMHGECPYGLCTSCLGDCTIVPTITAGGFVRDGGNSKGRQGSIGNADARSGDKGKGRPAGKSAQFRRQAREQSIAILDGEAQAGFSIRPCVLGKGGENFQYIIGQTGVRLVLEDSRGPCDGGAEPTHIRIMSTHASSDFNSAVDLVSDLVERVREANAARGKGKGGKGKSRFTNDESWPTGNMALVRAAANAGKAEAKRLHDEAAQLQAAAQRQAEAIAERESTKASKLRSEAERIENQIRQHPTVPDFPTLMTSVQPELKHVKSSLDASRFRAEEKNQTRALRENAAEVRKRADKSETIVVAIRDSSQTDPKNLVSALGKVRDGECRKVLEVCSQALKAQKDARAAEQNAQDLLAAPGRSRSAGPPPEGVTIERCSVSQLADLKKLWHERKAQNSCILEAWRIDNPVLTWKFNTRREELKQALGRHPDELQGFHGTHPDNVVSICRNGFDRGRRAGQVYGSGEYFAKCPDVSVGYCRQGEYMLVCRLCLGFPSSTQGNVDGDHIWVPQCGYYVISSPTQVLPLYIARFDPRGGAYAGFGVPSNLAPQCKELKEVLSCGTWTTKKTERIVPVPTNRRCFMSRPETTLLWIGFLHSHLSDNQLDQDVRCFLREHASSYAEGLKVLVIKGTYKKATIVLPKPMPRDLVHNLNRLPFIEGGVERTVCVEDGHGSPEQRCPKWIAGYCRGQNLRFTHPCYCKHPKRETEGASYHLENVDLSSAKANEIVDKFMQSAPFHNGCYPRVVALKAVINRTLERCHEEYRKYLTTKHGDEPTVRELYHGTNNNILDVVYTHGLQPPADTNASEACPVSGGKGLTTTLCNNDCGHCTEKHEWAKCHMFGLGIYLADISQKSHRYCSQPYVTGKGTRRYRMVVCSVLGRAYTVEGHLRHAEAMHDVVTVRALQEDELAAMVEPICQPCAADTPSRVAEVAEKSDLIFVQGLGGQVRPGFSVVNSEYIAFHPHQCLPKYEITYEMDL